MSSKLNLIALFSTVALLAGCGGGSDDPAPPPPPPAATDAVPESASASAQGLKKYLSDLSMDTTDTKDALELTSFDPKLVEDAEPEDVE